MQHDQQQQQNIIDPSMSVLKPLPTSSGSFTPNNIGSPQQSEEKQNLIDKSKSETGNGNRNESSAISIPNNDNSIKNTSMDPNKSNNSTMKASSPTNLKHKTDIESGNQANNGEITIDSLARMVKDNQLTYLSEHLGGTKSLAAKLGCENTENGLPNSFDFEEQRKRFGKNSVDLPPLKSYFRYLLESFEDLTIILLTIAAIVSLILGLAFHADPSAWIEGTAILASVGIVVFFQATMDYTKARRFRQQQESIENKKEINVIRDGGKTIAIHPRDIVVGDIIRLAIGDIIPADGVLVDGFGIKMDESALTGESKLLLKVPLESLLNHESGDNKKKEDDEVTPFVLSGTNVMDGQGRMLVAAVGVNSVQGRILSLVSNNKKTVAKANYLPEENNNNGNLLPKEGQGENEEDALLMKAVVATAPKGATNAGVSVSSRRPQSKRGKKSSSFCCKCNCSIYEGRGEGGGGSLMEKLDYLAIDISKVGLSVATIVFVYMLIRWAVTEFAYGGVCTQPDNISSYQNCTMNEDQGCSFNNGTNTCNRIWYPDTDAIELLNIFITAISILVVTIPEGLPLAVTLSIAIAMKRMIKENNQVKHMDSCETMGSATTVCSDKTGTLTENRMTVMKVSFSPTKKGTIYSHDITKNIDVGNVVISAAAASTNSDIGSNQCKLSKDIVKLVAEALSLNTMPTSKAIESPPGTWKYIGNPTECALLKLVLQLGYDFTNIRSKHAPVVDPEHQNAPSRLDWGVHTFPFSSTRKRMSWVVKKEGSEGYRLYTKGAPNAIFDVADSVLDPETMDTVPFTPELIKEYEDIVETFQSDAMRTIALGYRDFDTIPENGWDDPQNEFSKITIIIVFGIEDPLRPTVRDAIDICNGAGVDVRMCTGDALVTAIAIAKQCHILRSFDIDPATGQPKPFFAMTGAEFDERVHVLDVTQPKILRRTYDFEKKKICEQMAYPFLVDEIGEKVINQNSFDKIWPKLRVLSRCLPEDKLTLVRGLRASRLFRKTTVCRQLMERHNIDIFPDYQIVAVIGDGTNDAPAMKSADVGFSMGIVGTEIAKQACDIILLDDNFASVVAAIKWGRNVFDAISKFIQFQLTISLTAIMISIVGILAFNQNPLSAVQMLWLNLINDTLASIAFASEKPTISLLKRKPYGKKTPIISRPVLTNVIGQSSLQLCIIFIILFDPSWIPGDVEQYPPPGTLGNSHSAPSIHWTFLFNVYVWLQLFNQFNSRRLPTAKRLRQSATEWNVFYRVFDNPYFCIILAIEAGLQVIIVQFGGQVFDLAQGGLTGAQWGVCIGLGLLSLPWQIVIYAFMAYTFKPSHRLDKIRKEFGTKEATEELDESDPREPIKTVDIPSNTGEGSEHKTETIQLPPGIAIVDQEGQKKRALENWKRVRTQVLFGVVANPESDKAGNADEDDDPIIHEYERPFADKNDALSSRSAGLIIRGPHRDGHHYPNSKLHDLEVQDRVSEIAVEYLNRSARSRSSRTAGPLLSPVIISTPNAASTAPPPIGTDDPDMDAELPMPKIAKNPLSLRKLAKSPPTKDDFEAYETGRLYKTIR